MLKVVKSWQAQLKNKSIVGDAVEPLLAGHLNLASICNPWQRKELLIQFDFIFTLLLQIGLDYLHKIAFEYKFEHCLFLFLLSFLSFEGVFPQFLDFQHSQEALVCIKKSKPRRSALMEDFL